MGKRNLKTDAQLVQAGYHHVQTRKCSYHPCTAQIEVWRTNGGSLMPFDRLMMTASEAAALGMDIMPGMHVVAITEPHFGSCKGLEARKAKRAAGEHQEPEPEPAAQ